MIDIKLIREDIENIKKGLASKKVKPIDIEDVSGLDKKHREVLSILEAQKSDQNRISEEIPKTEDNEERNKKINQMQELKVKIKELEEEVAKIKEELDLKLNSLPNVPFEDALVGNGEDDNKELRKFGEVPNFDFDVKDHMELGESLDIVDTKQAAEVSGSRFYYLKNEAVLLEFALVQLAFETLLKEGFNLIVPPTLIKPDMYMRMGRLLGGQEEERYYLPNDELYLVGSAEHTIGPIHADHIFEEKDLPKRYVGFSSSFRREAGSYGKDVKGILRAHQFDKIEMFSFSKPEDSRKEHEFLLSMQEKMMQVLGLPHRVVEVCTGDMGFTDAKQFDVETWIPSQKKYRETHSCSNTTDFQARGINAKYKDSKTKKRELVHMLNATGFATGRMIIAILENNQQKDGSVKIPEALQKYTHGVVEIRKK